MSRLAAAPLLALALAACAVPEWQKPGTPLADIERTMGRPTLAEPLESGGQRLVRVTQVLTLENFQALRNGLDTQSSVLRRFGPPALLERVASFDGPIWTYRILDNGEPRQAHVHIDPAGVVRRVMFTDERLRDLDPPH